jgi:hypothetical protein
MTLLNLDIKPSTDWLKEFQELQSVEVADLHAASFFGLRIPRGKNGRTSEVHRD